MSDSAMSTAGQLGEKASLLLVSPISCCMKPTPSLIGHASDDSMCVLKQSARSSNYPGLDSESTRSGATPSPNFLAAVDVLIQTHLAELTEANSSIWRQRKDAQALVTPPLVTTPRSPRSAPPELHSRSTAAVKVNFNESLPAKEIQGVLQQNVDLRLAEDIQYKADPVKERYQSVFSGISVTRQAALRGSDGLRGSGGSKSRKYSKKSLRKTVSTRASTIMQTKAKELVLFGNIAEKLMDGTEIDEYEYDVAMYYKDEGYAQAVARSGWFGLITLAFITCNAVYLGIDSDYNNAETVAKSDPGWIIMEQIFCTFFTFELACRFIAFEEKRNCFRDGWFKFDFFLVVAMVFETWVLGFVALVQRGDSVSLPTGPLKMLRLMRLARMARLCRAFPELATIMKALYVAMRAVGSAMVFLVVIIYVFSIAMHSLLKDDESVYEYWGTVTRCMMSLIVNGTFADSIGKVMRAIARNVPALICFMAFVLASAITVINMLVGLLCEVVSEVANAEKEYNTLSKLKSEILVMLKRGDTDDTGAITRDAFMSILSDGHASSVMHNLGIDVKHLAELIDMMFAMEETICIPDIMHLLLASQGDRKPTFQDLVKVLGLTRWIMQTDVASMKLDVLAIKRDLKSSLDLLTYERVEKVKMEARVQALNDSQVRTVYV